MCSETPSGSLRSKKKQSQAICMQKTGRTVSSNPRFQTAQFHQYSTSIMFMVTPRRQGATVSSHQVRSANFEIERLESWCDC